MLTKPSLTLKRRLNASPAQVFSAWADPEKIVRWFGPAETSSSSVRANGRPGGRYGISFKTEDGEYHEIGGVYREVVPDTRLVFSLAWPSTLAHHRIAPAAGGVHALRVRDGAGVRRLFFLEGDRTMPHQIVSRDEWLAARKALLAKEKAFTKERDALSQERRRLPWVKVDKTYVFEGSAGKETLADLFAGRSQLLVSHFMFGPDWKEGCPSCSFWADNYNGAVVHLSHRDVSLVAISRAPLEKLESYRKRMGWSFKWVSSYGNDFNRDYHVSFTPEEQKTAVYNYKAGGFGSSEAPGVSVFIKGADGQIFHTYSCYARGLDMLNGAYHLLDLVPKGRDEQGLSYPMAWVRRHDQYEG